MSIVNLQTGDVNEFKPLRPIGPGPRPIVVRQAKGRKPRRNARENWPAWTDWARISTITEDDEPRPTAPPDFIPTADEELEWERMLARVESRHEPRESDGYAPGYCS